MTVETIADLLEHHAFFAGMPPEDLALIAGCGQNTGFRPGQFLFHEGEPAERFYVIRHGRVALEIHAPGKGPLVIDTIGAGQLVGVSWLFPPYRWNFDGRAVEATQAIELDGACLRGKCDADPRFGYTLMKRFAAVLERRMQSARLRLLDLYGHADSA
jgi:CRP/FNR family cyclic AMP-dependent transcriptional regulator